MWAIFGFVLIVWCLIFPDDATKFGEALKATPLNWLIMCLGWFVLMSLDRIDDTLRDIRREVERLRK